MRDSPNPFMIGIFAANCSGGNCATTVPERWEPTWANNLEIARMADESGLEFMLPLGRWAGYGGETDHNGTSFETLTWAAGLLAQTKRIMAFSTVHVTLTNPVAAAKQMATIDHLGNGRFGLNIVCGWNRDEFEMLGAKLDGHSERYELGQEWIDIVTRIWRDDKPFDHHGRHFQLKHVYGRPKPVQSPRPVIMNAGASANGLDFAVRNADFLFTSFTTPEDALARTSRLKANASAQGRKVGIFTTTHVVCRPSRKEAEEYVHYYSVENADDGAVETMFVGRGWRDNPNLDASVKHQMRRRLASANGGHMIVGTPDDVTAQMAALSQSGLDGIAMGLVNYTAHFPYVRDEVLPRLERLKLRTGG